MGRDSLVGMLKSPIAVTLGLLTILSILAGWASRIETKEHHREDMEAHKAQEALERKVMIRDAFDEWWARTEMVHHKKYGEK